MNPLLPVRQRQLTARNGRSEGCWACCLLEPRRWHEVQKQVHLEDFTDELHRQLAETYWSHQQDEGEPVFNEFLGMLENENLRELAVLCRSGSRNPGRS